MPPEENNEIKSLSEFSDLIANCKCKPKIHTICLKSWTKNNLSCPICRTKITINIFHSGNNKFINCYIYCIQSTVKLFKIICYTSFLNLLVIFFYNIYYIYFLNDIFNKDNL